MSGDSGLERGLTAVLVDLRPAGPAPAALRDRVLATPERLGYRPRLARLLQRLPSLAGAAALVAAAVVIAAVVLRSPGASVVPPGVVGTPRTAFDPNLEGPGILRSVETTLTWMPTVIGVVAIVGFLYVLSRGRMRLGWRVLALLGCVLVGLGALVLRTVNVRDGSATAILSGFAVQVPGVEGFDGTGQFFETAGPGDHSVIMFSVRNTSAIPVTIDGVLVDEPVSDDVPTWSAAWLPTVQTLAINGLDDLRPFAPTVVAPGAELDIYLVGKPGRCAYGPTFTLNSPIAGSYGLDDSARVAYSAFGLRNFAIVRTRLDAMEPIREGCQGG